MRTGIVVQARMTSSRLPGKILREVLGRPLLQYQLERLAKVPGVQEIRVATTDRPTDDPVEALCRKLGYPVTRGSEDDVLSRYELAARQGRLDAIARVTADCPVIDPDETARVIQAFLASQSTAEPADYVSNSLKRTYPRGLDTEIFSRKVLDEMFAQARKPHEREHVTPYVYGHPEKFRLLNISHEGADLSHHRWTVDTPEDFELISLLIGEAYPRNPDFRLKDLLAVLERHPDWSRINAAIEQKKLTE